MGVSIVKNRWRQKKRQQKSVKREGKMEKVRGGWGQRRKRLKGSQQMGSEKKDEVKQRTWGVGGGGVADFYIAHLLVV